MIQRQAVIQELRTELLRQLEVIDNQPPSIYRDENIYRIFQRYFSTSDRRVSRLYRCLRRDRRLAKEKLFREHGALDLKPYVNQQQSGTDNP